MMPSPFWFAAIPASLIFVPTLIAVIRQPEKEGVSRLLVAIGWTAAFSLVAVPLGLIAMLAVYTGYGRIAGAQYLFWVPAVSFGVSVSILLTMYLRQQRVKVHQPRRRDKIPIPAVVGVMVLLLAIDCGVTALLSNLDVNVFPAHMLLMGAGIFLGGGASMLGAERFSTLVFSISGGLLTSFLLIVLLPVETVLTGSQRKSEFDGSSVVFALICAAVLFGASSAICKATMPHLRNRSA